MSEGKIEREREGEKGKISKSVKERKRESYKGEEKESLCIKLSH